MDSKPKHSILFLTIIFVILIIARNYFNKFSAGVDGIMYKRKYVDSYLKDNYGESNYSIKYDSSGKCLVSGDCGHKVSNSALGYSCSPSQYLENDKCKSYYYKVKTTSNEFIVTVVNRKGLITVVEDKYIYGSEPIYTSPLYSFGLGKQKLAIGSNGELMLYTGISDDKNTVFILGDFSSLNVNLYMTTEYYDAKNNLVGICRASFKELIQNDTSTKMGRDSNLSFKCQISKSELVRGKKFDDIVYYKVIIS